MSYVRLIYVLYLLGDGLHLFWFSRKTVHAHISGRQNKNKLKKNTWKLANKLYWVPTSLYTSFLSVNFGENVPDSCAAFGCSNRKSTTSLQFYRIPSAKRCLEGRIKWVTAMRREKWPAEKINNARICSAHFAIGKPS